MSETDELDEECVSQESFLIKETVVFPILFVYYNNCQVEFNINVARIILELLDSLSIALYLVGITWL